MELIRKEGVNKEISDNYNYDFKLENNGLYLIEIIAKAKSWWQNFKNFKLFFNDDDLMVKVDGKKMELAGNSNSKEKLRDGWNGNELKGLLKTVLVAINLEKGWHSLNFMPDQSPYLKSIKISKVEEQDKIIYIPEDNNPAERGDGRPWMSYVLVDLSIKELKILAKADKRGRDDDDLKLIINGKIEKNSEDIFHKNWFWCGKILKGEEKEYSELINLSKGNHHIELWADNSPFLRKIEIGLTERQKDSKDQLSPKYIIKQISDLYKEIGEEIKLVKIPAPFKDSSKYDQEITAAAKEFNVDPIILKATLAQESSFGQAEYNSWHDWRYVGESGLMGMEKRTSVQRLKDMGYKFNYNKIGDVIRASAAYYNWVRDRKTSVRFQDKNNPLKLYTQYRQNLKGEGVDTIGIPQFLYHYFYFKNQQ